MREQFFLGSKYRNVKCLVKTTQNGYANAQKYISIRTLPEAIFLYTYNTILCRVLPIFQSQYSHLSNKREITLTDFEKFHPPQKKSPLHIYWNLKKIYNNENAIFSLFIIPFPIMEIADTSEHNLHRIR